MNTQVNVGDVIEINTRFGGVQRATVTEVVKYVDSSFLMAKSSARGGSIHQLDVCANGYRVVAKKVAS